MANRLQLKLFGSPHITYQGKLVTGFVSNKARALLIYLAVTGRPHSRDHLAELLWADTPATRRENLKKALSNLRRREGVTLVEEGRHLVALDPAHYWVDVAEFDRLSTTAAPDAIDTLQRTVQLYQGDFLTGFNLSVSYEFEVWALGEQTRLKEQLVEVLRRLAEGYAQRHELPQAIATMRRLLQLEPWREEAHRQLIEWLAQSGDRSAALAQFQHCIDALRSELDADPTPQTRNLYEQIRAGSYLAPVTLVAQPAVAHQRPRFSWLPTPPTQFVGRQSVLAAITALLERDEVRLVTLTGTGGVGKTRLALQIGHTMLPQFADGAVFVELAPIRAAPLVMVTIAEALGVRESAGNRPLSAHISDYLRDKELLLIVDNFEHLLEAAPLISTILADAPRVRFLVTSRAVLHLRGEFEFVVPPLHLPPLPISPDQSANQQLDTVESVQLFVQQARAVQPTFILDTITAPHVVSICIRLDGLPLAIELAAARLKVLGVATIAERLEARFALLQQGPRDAPLRHQTLQNAVDWSYDLLTDEEQALFRRLSVFVGGCTLAAVEAIWSATDASDNTLNLVTSLVDKSLLLRQEQDDSVLRFTQLETILAYGQEKLCATGELAAAQDAHAGYFLQLAEQAEPMLFGGEQTIWLARLGREHDNLRAALRWSLQKEEPSMAARLGIALWHYWYIRSHHQEGSAWLEQIQKRILPSVERAKVLYGLGMLARRTGNDDLVVQQLTEALSLFQQVGEEYFIASSLRVLGFIDYRRHNHDAAQQKLEEALRLFRRLDNIEGVAVTLNNLGYCQLAQCNYVSAAQYFDGSLIIRRQTGNQHGVANCLDSMGAIAMQQHDYAQAKTLLAESRTIYETLGNPLASERSVHFLGAIAYIEGAYADADAYFAQALIYAQQSDNLEPLSENQFGLALTKFQFGDSRTAFVQLQKALRYFSRINKIGKIVTCLAIFGIIALPNHCISLGVKAAAKVMQMLETARTHILFETLTVQMQNAVANARTDANHDVSQYWAEGEAMTLDELVSHILEMPIADV